MRPARAHRAFGIISVLGAALAFTAAVGRGEVEIIEPEVEQPTPSVVLEPVAA